MKISTRGRYALRVLVDLAENAGENYVPMSEVAARQEISLKYLEQILPLLRKNNIIEGLHGKGGGYRLSRKPEDCTVGEVLRLTEGSLAPVSCLACKLNTCPRKENCRTLPMWTKFEKIVNEYFGNVTIADLMRK